MFNRFAQWCDWMRPYSGARQLHCPRVKNVRAGNPAFRHGFRRLICCAAFAFSVSFASADVGLPAYAGPESGDVRLRPELPALVRPISHGSALAAGTPLHCDLRTEQQNVALDFAPPPDYRIDLHGALTPAGSGTTIPLYIESGQALLKTGAFTNRVKAIHNRGRMLLVSEDRNYLDRLQSIRPDDTLLVRTSDTLRRYRVTGASIRHAALPREANTSAQTLTLAACYPFQPVGSAALLYEISAQMVGEQKMSPDVKAEGLKLKLVSF